MRYAYFGILLLVPLCLTIAEDGIEEEITVTAQTNSLVIWNIHGGSYTVSGSNPSSGSGPTSTQQNPNPDPSLVCRVSVACLDGVTYGCQINGSDCSAKADRCGFTDLRSRIKEQIKGWVKCGDYEKKCANYFNCNN